jgi:hypothetical protein
VTVDQLREHAIRKARESRVAQGFEEHVTDPELLSRVVALVVVEEVVPLRDAI